MNILRTSHLQRGAGAFTLLGFVLVGLGLAGMAAHFWFNRSAVTGATTSPQGRPSAAVPAAASVMPPNASQVVAGLNPAWFGRWQGTTPLSVPTVSATDFILEAEVERDGSKVRTQSVCKWSRADEDNLPQDGSCAFGYTRTSKSLAAVARDFEESVAAFQRDPTDFQISDPGRGRLDLTSIRPGTYRMVWLYEGGDCGYSEFMVDGDSMLRVSRCKYRHLVERYARQGGPPFGEGQPGQVFGAVGGVPALPNGRWQGDVMQAGYGQYAAVIQLQATAAGIPAETMAYPSLGCTASLTFLRSAGNAVWFTESIQVGKGKCRDGG